MSADNAIGILITNDHLVTTNDVSVYHDAPVTAYRVGVVFGPDEFFDLLDRSPYTLGAWMYSNFLTAAPVYSREEADNIAVDLLNKEGHVEYGVIEMDARPICFPFA